MYRKIMDEASEKGVIVANKCIEKGIQLSAIKLELLLILMHGRMLSKYQKPFFRQNVVAGKQVLMIKEVDRNFILNKFDERMQEYLVLLLKEEEVMNDIIEVYGSLDFFEMIKRKDLTFLRELCYKEGELNIVPNELIEKVFDYYNFYDMDYVKKQEEFFQKRMVKQYKK